MKRRCEALKTKCELMPEAFAVAASAAATMAEAIILSAMSSDSEKLTKAAAREAIARALSIVDEQSQAYNRDVKSFMHKTIVQEATRLIISG